jgi:hypothetical protein
MQSIEMIRNIWPALCRIMMEYFALSILNSQYLSIQLYFTYTENSVTEYSADAAFGIADTGRKRFHTDSLDKLDIWTLGFT